MKNSTVQRQVMSSQILQLDICLHSIFYLNISSMSANCHKVAPFCPRDRSDCVIVVGQVAEAGHLILALYEIKFLK